MAAVTQPSGWEHGSWAAAFLVLVMGVAQIGLVTGQALLARVLPGSGYFAVECALWNVGGLFVIVGTVWSTPVVVSVGSAFLVVVVGMVIGAVGGAGADSRPLPVLFRCLLVVLVVSIPIGTVLAWVRS